MIDRNTFRALDDLHAPDLSAQVIERMAAPQTPVPPSFGGRRRATAVVVAFAVFVVGTAIALRAFERLGSRNAETTPSPTALGDGLAPIPEGWTELPPPPQMLPGTSYVWTGREIVAFGGSLPKAADYAPSANGYAFDPSTTTWNPIPAAPMPAKRARPVWTGKEAIFLGVGTDQSAWQGEAFDPITRSWRVIAPSPLTPRAGAVITWTGKEMIVFGGGRRGDLENIQGAAYDPATDSWRAIARAPIGLNAASAVWDGKEMIVFGSLLDAGNHAPTATAVGEAYDPASDSWREIAPSSLSPQASAAVWTAGQMVAYDYDWKAEAYAPSTDRWRELPSLPFHAGECYPDGTVVAGEVFAFGCGEVATWIPGDVAWRTIHGGITDATIKANAGVYQLWRFATLAPAGDVVFLAAEGLTVTKNGVPCYGCPGSPTSFWAYRPPG